MAQFIYMGNFTSPLDSLTPIGVFEPPFYTYRIVGYVDIPSTNTLSQFDLVTPSVNARDPDRVYTGGLTIPTGAWVRRRAIRIPSTNTAGRAATLVGTTGDRLVLGTGNTDSAAGNMVQAASSSFASGPYRVDVFNPTALASPLALRLFVANTGNTAAGTAPTVSTGGTTSGTIRVLWEVVYQAPSEVVTIDEIPNGNK